MDLCVCVCVCVYVCVCVCLCYSPPDSPAPLFLPSPGSCLTLLHSSLLSFSSSPFSACPWNMVCYEVLALIFVFSWMTVCLLLWPHGPFFCLWLLNLARDLYFPATSWAFSFACPVECSNSVSKTTPNPFPPNPSSTYLSRFSKWSHQWPTQSTW